MFNRRVLFLSVFYCALFMLSGCSSNRFASRDANATYVNTQLKIIPRSQEKIQAQSQCSRSFSLLQKLNTDKFSMYRNQFDEINDAYFFYKRNVSLKKFPERGALGILCCINFPPFHLLKLKLFITGIN